MRGSDFAELRAFAIVAEHGSFIRAAERLSLTASAISQTVRELEERLGVRLLHRTTRSVSLTDAGAKLLHRLRPVLDELDAATREMIELREKPSGTIRIVIPRIAFVDHFQPMLDQFCMAYPDVVLDITVDDGITDIVAHGYDLGVRLGEYLEEEVVAIRLSGPLRQLAVASPEYVARHGRPKHPEISIHTPVSIGGNMEPP